MVTYQLMNKDYPVLEFEYDLETQSRPVPNHRSSLAQEESHSISENCTWGQRKRFTDGKVSVAYSRFLGSNWNL